MPESPTPDEIALVERLLTQLQGHIAANQVNGAYYEGEQFSRLLNISIPPNMTSLKTVAGWAGTVVDVLDERIDFLGWTTEGDDPFGLAEVYAANDLGVDSGLAHLDSLIYGTSFVIVGAGEEGEPNPLVTPMSPNLVTVDWDARRRRAKAAIALDPDSKPDEPLVILYLPNQTVVMAKNRGVWSVLDRDHHNLGRVPVVALRNRLRGSRLTGRSEISKAVKYLVDAGVRTLLGMEISREFYASPQRWLMGASLDEFQNADGSAVSAWQAILGRVWAVPSDEHGNVPSVGQFAAASPAPYLDQLAGLREQLAAEAGIPATYLGDNKANAASADAIRAAEARLVKRAERRQSTFSMAWLEVARLALLVRDGQIPEDFSKVSTRWRDPSTPTRAAQADEAAKLIGSGVLPADSVITYDRIGLTPSEQRALTAEKRRANGRSALQALAIEKTNASGQ